MPIGFWRFWHAGAVFAIFRLMPFNSKSGKEAESHLRRDNKGHFISSQRETSSLIKGDGTRSDFKVTSPLDVKLNPEFEKPIVSVNINNPLRKILYWLDQIRRHQTTTLAFKLSIPLVVIPVIIAAAFSVGRVSGLGMTSLNPLYNPPRANPTPAPAVPVTISRTGILKIAKSATTLSYLLSLKSGDNIILEIPGTINLSKYANKQILVTGLFNKTANILKVTDIAEVQIFNPTVVVEASQGAK